MRSASLANDRLLRWLLSAPELAEGVESLGYWRERHRRLPWYRIRARREAAMMTVRWEQRVGAALIAQRGAPVATRLSAGVLIARTRLGRWTSRAKIAAITTVTVLAALVAIPTAAALAFLLHLL